MSSEPEPNVGLAFGLVCAAGAATAIGASVVFFPSLVKLASKRVLASALGFSAGVMLYVSFVEIFAKSIDSFRADGFEEKWAYLYATLCFFGGVVIMIFIDLLVKLISGDHHHHHDEDHAFDQRAAPQATDAEKGAEDVDEVVAPHYCIGCIDDPAAELEEWQKRAQAEEEEQQRKQHRDATGHHSVTTEGSSNTGNTSGIDPEIGNKPGVLASTKNVGTGPTTIHEHAEGCLKKDDGSDNDHSHPGEALVSDDAQSMSSSLTAERRENKKLVRMGINTAVAIGLHNFPEGLATFVAALDDPRVGAVLAVAIGIHNIPEGLCVSLPIYYATGNRCKAFWWACLSGFSEPVAALLGWLVLARVFSETLYAVLFGIVAGMMVIISVKELLPTAHRYDMQDSVVTYSLIAGMVVMALSLVLFML